MVCIAIFCTAYGYCEPPQKISVILTDIGINESLLEKYSLERKTISISGSESNRISSLKRGRSEELHSGQHINSVGTYSGNRNLSKDSAQFSGEATSNDVSVRNINFLSNSGNTDISHSNNIRYSYTSKTTEGYSILRIRDAMPSKLEHAFFATGRFEIFNHPEIPLDNIAAFARFSNGMKIYAINTVITDFIDRFEDSDNTQKRIFSLSAITRIMDITTGKLIASISSEIDESGSEIEKGVRRRNGEFGDELIDLSAKRLATDIAKKFEESIYPPSVVQVDTSYVYINKILKRGTRLRILRKSDAIKDPVSGEIYGYKTKEIGIAEVNGYLGEKVSICKLLEKSANIEIGDSFETFEESVSDIGTRREQQARIENQDIRKQLANSKALLVKAKNLIRDGQKLVKEGESLAASQDYIAAAGTTLARHVSMESTRRNGRNMLSKGGKMIAEGEDIQRQVDALIEQVVNTCEKVSLQSKEGKSIVCIILTYENNNITILLGDKVLTMKDTLLDEESKLRIDGYRNN